MSNKFLDDVGLTYLWGKLKALLATKADKTTATATADGLMSAADKQNLDLLVGNIDGEVEIWDVTGQETSGNTVTITGHTSTPYEDVATALSHNIMPILRFNGRLYYIGGMFSEEEGAASTRYAFIHNGQSVRIKVIGVYADETVLYTYPAGGAPQFHQSTDTTYGTGTQSAYGHVKVIDNVTSSSYTAGEALAAHQGYVLKQAVDGKQASITGGASTITSTNLTASRALVSNTSGKVAVSAVTSTELGYLDGVTSSIQTQLDTTFKRTVVTTTGTNLNDYKTSGFYLFGSDYTPTNIPVGVNGILLVISGNTGDPFTTQGKQYWFRLGTPNSNSFMTYERMFTTNSGWGEWTKFLTEKDLKTSLAINGANNAQIRLDTTNYSGGYIRAYDASEYGQNWVAQSGGNMIIGGGEFPSSMYSGELDDCTDTGERLYLGADNDVNVYSNANTIADRKRWMFSTDGSLYLPNTEYPTGTNMPKLTQDGNLYMKTSTVEGWLSTILNGKQDTVTGAASTCVSSNLTASRALGVNANGKIAVASTTTTELNYLHGVTSSVQDQIDKVVPSLVHNSSTGMATTAVAGGENANAGQFTLAAGWYIVTISAQWNSSSGGNRQLWLANSNTGNARDYNSWSSVYGASGAVTHQQVTCLLAPTASTTYYIVVKHGSTSNLSCTTRYSVMRLASK